MPEEVAQDEATEDIARPYIVNIPDGMEGEEWAELMGQHLRMFQHAPTDAQDYNTHVYFVLGHVAGRRSTEGCHHRSSQSLK